MSDENVQPMASTDLAFAATMMSLGHGLAGLQIILEGNGRRAKGEFLFADTPELRKDEKDYWAARCRVEPLGFASHQKSLKSQVNQEISRLENS